MGKLTKGMSLPDALDYMESLTVQTYGFNDLDDITIDQSNKGYVSIIAKDDKGNMIDIKLWCNTDVTVKNIHQK